MELLVKIIGDHFSHLIIALASIVSAVLATYFTLRGQLKRDEKNRLYEQRKIAYEKITWFFIEGLKVAKLKTKNFNTEEINKRFFDILKPLLIYGSSEVMKKYKDFQSFARTNESNKINIIYAMEDVLIQIRKELNPKENPQRGDILSLFITDLKNGENAIK